MKIRWTSKSLRLRINPDELAELRRGLPVSEEIVLPGGSWSATIYPTEDATGISLRRAGALGFLVSSSDLAKLAADTSEGVYFSTTGEQPVRYYIEKDFPCAHPSHRDYQEAASPTFASPAGFKGSCADE
jgi:hypothetical protein